MNLTFFFFFFECILFLHNFILYYQGNAVNSFTLNGTKFPLVYGKDASSSCSEEGAR